LGLGFKNQGSGSRVQGPGSRVQGPGFKGCAGRPPVDTARCSFMYAGFQPSAGSSWSLTLALIFWKYVSVMRTSRFVCQIGRNSRTRISRATFWPCESNVAWQSPPPLYTCLGYKIW